MDNLTSFVPNKHLVTIISEYVQFILPYHLDLLATTNYLHYYLNKCYSTDGEFKCMNNDDEFKIHRSQKIWNETKVEWGISTISTLSKKFKKYILKLDGWEKMNDNYGDYYHNVKKGGVIQFI